MLRVKCTIIYVQISKFQDFKNAYKKNNILISQLKYMFLWVLKREHPKHMLKLISKKILTIFYAQILCLSKQTHGVFNCKIVIVFKHVFGWLIEPSH